MTNDDKYFYVNDDGVLEAYMAQIQYLKAKTLYVENMYLGKRQVQWKNKEIVIATKSSRTQVLTGVTVKSKNIGHSHKINNPGTSTTTMGMSKNYDHSHDVSKSTVSVVSSSSDTRDQIVYLG